MKKITIIILLMVNYSFLTAQNQKNDANITGHVIDAKTKEHLPYIRIGIKGTTIGTLTDASGHFFLKHLPEGDFTVVASSVGYSTSEQPVRIERGKTIDVSIELSGQAVSLSEVVVTSDRNETNKQESSSIVNVLSARTFDLTASNNLAQVLNFQTGLRVENTCQNCGVPQLRINGLEGQYSQILLDSRPVFSSLAAVYGLEQMPVSMIERVEIIRGGGSALFGSNAIGGVVNIITKEPLRNTLTISNQSNWVGGKSYDINTSLNGAFVSDNSKAGVYIFAMIRNRQQYDRDGDGFTEIPKLNSETVGFRGYYKTSNYSKLTLEYHHISEYRRGGNHLELPPDRVDIAEQLQHAIDGGGLIFDLFSKSYKHKFSFYTSLQNIDRKSYFGTNQDPDAYGKTNDVTIIGGSQYRYSMKKCLFLPADLTVGVEYNYNSLKDEMLGYHRVTLQNVHILGAYAQNEWKSKKVNFLIGARLDKHNFIKNPVFSPRVNVRYTPVDLVGLRLSYSSGFRAPQAYEEDLHVGAVGGDVMLISLDPGLKPEKSNSVSFSADFNKTFGQWETNFLVEGFFTDISNVFTLVEQGRDGDGNLLMQRQNASGARVYGVNAEIKVVYGRKLTMQLGYTYQQSRYKEDFTWSENTDLEPQRKMFRSPDSYGFMMINYTPFKNFDIAFSGNYSGSMLVQHYAGYIPEDAETVTKSFWDMVLKLSYDIPLSDRTKLQVSIGIKNMLDSFQPDIDKGSLRDAGYIYGPALPRTGYVGVKFSM